jgi:hypothetical protein
METVYDLAYKAGKYWLRERVNNAARLIVARMLSTATPEQAEQMARDWERGYNDGFHAAK